MTKKLTKFEKEQKEKEDQLKNFQVKIAGLSKWRKHYQQKIKLAREEIILKMKAPLPIELEYEYEQLPEWREHYAKAHQMAINEQIMQWEVEIFDGTQRINMLKEEIKKLR